MDIILIKTKSVKIVIRAVSPVRLDLVVHVSHATQVAPLINTFPMVIASTAALQILTIAPLPA